MLLVSGAIRHGGHLENLHAGYFPETKTGDYSDVYVVDGHGRRIEWNQLSRISDEEMKAFMKDAVDRVYTTLMEGDDPDYSAVIRLYMSWARGWDKPQIIEDLRAKNTKHLKI